MAAPAITIHGDDELRHKLNSSLAAKPVRRMFDRWGIGTASDARGRAPVDLNRLRGGITNETDSSHLPRWARVGTNVRHAAAVEGGTGIFGELKDSKRQRYFPPPAVLEPWARRKGMPPGSGFLVARKIWQRGGTKAQPFLRPALEASKGRIDGLVRQAAREIEAQASG